MENDKLEFKKIKHRGCRERNKSSVFSVVKKTELRLVGSFCLYSFCVLLFDI